MHLSIHSKKLMKESINEHKLKRLSFNLKEIYIKIIKIAIQSCLGLQIAHHINKLVEHGMVWKHKIIHEEEEN